MLRYPLWEQRSSLPSNIWKESRAGQDSTNVGFKHHKRAIYFHGKVAPSSFGKHSATPLPYMQQFGVLFCWAKVAALKPERTCMY